MTVRQAIVWLNDYNSNDLLELEYGYEGIESGCIYSVRPETDEEEYARENAEEIAEAKAQERIQYMQEIQTAKEAAMLQSKVALDVALWAYLDKHKDNPRKADLSNLFLARAQLERDGNLPHSYVVRNVVECMEKIENGT